MRKLDKKIKSGRVDVNTDDQFELFIAGTNIRYCYYAETHKILGNTYGMAVLQVREASAFPYLKNGKVALRPDHSGLRHCFAASAPL